MYQFFQNHFDTITTVLPYNEKWENGTGYFDFAGRGEHAPKLAPGAMAKSTTPQGRNIIFVGTRFGNVVVFKRYSDPESKVIVGNYPKEIVDLFLGSCIGSDVRESLEMLPMLLGTSGQKLFYNIGTKIENLFAAR